MFRIAYHTLGCKVNQYETEKIREALERAGFATVAFGSPADAYVINTCTVTSVADGKSRAAVRRAVKANPEAFVVVAGCYADLEPDAIRAIEGVDLVVPNEGKDAIAERVIAGLSPKSKVESRKSGGSIPQSAIRNPQSVAPRLRTRAVVKVQDGCDQFCSYCVVPYARSRKGSRPLDEVLAETRALAEFGHKEIVLTGIRLGAYASRERKAEGGEPEGSGERRAKSEERRAEGGEPEGSGLQVRGTASGTTCPGRTRTLPDLVRAVGEIEGVERVRLSSVEPWEVDDALVEAMRQLKVCRHLHIPLQSGDDEILRRMNRPYTAAEYRHTVSRVRAAIPGIGITTDVIVGFPGETEEAFERTRALIEQIGFSRLHVFRYSARNRTPAASMPDQVPAQAKKSRAQNLIELGKNSMRRFAKSMIGETVEVLAESRTRRPNQLIGFTDNYVEVSFPGDAALVGHIVRVRILGVDRDGCQVLGIRC